MRAESKCSLLVIHLRVAVLRGRHVADRCSLWSVQLCDAVVGVRVAMSNSGGRRSSERGARTGKRGGGKWRTVSRGDGAAAR